MTITELIPATVTVDLYRDIHKGIRAELFAVVGAAGRLDPADAVGRADLAAHLCSITDLLETHAEHEDVAIQPAIEQLFPAIAERIEADHHVLDARIRRVSERVSDAPLHVTYLDLASFTSAYLAHQDLEERELMPALEAAIGPEATLAIHQAIVGSIPPDLMARSLALMLPAMNVDDRTELLGGIKAGAPEEVFGGIWSLTGSVLEPADVTVLGRRLGVR